MRWIDTDDNREAFCEWFEDHDAMFTTLGSQLLLPAGGAADAGDWILFSDDEFIALDDDCFHLTYEEVA